MLFAASASTKTMMKSVGSVAQQSRTASVSVLLTTTRSQQTMISMRNILMKTIVVRVACVGVRSETATGHAMDSVHATAQHMSNVRTAGRYCLEKN